ncbi:MAG: M23 family metallopeptidase [Porticoccaceae bacterium]|jgi:murein DD-endopeptidase MepM/ murein hydrolase activator NlpD|nr:M23 family metallopeptidase [Porticoccaceae bacterium]MDG1307335.1 M23 family metallopeptidase [Porticoccaceae bacterium]
MKHKNVKICLAVCISLLLMPLSAVVKAEILEWQGSFQQGSLLLGQLPEGYQASYDKQRLQVTPKGQFLLGLGRQANTVIELVLTDSEGIETTEQFNVRERQYVIQRIEGVPQKTVTPRPKDVERIRSDSWLVKQARKDRTESLDFLAGFQRPLDGPITGVYGSQRFYNGIPKNPHYGVDYAAPTGTLVMAPASGVVRLAHRDLFYSGGTLIVDHGHGLSSTFLHLSDILVEEGMRVERGKPIAKVGATGRATGPHLDWRMNWRQVRIDPVLVLQTLPVQ